jgi:hypothetical protein
MSLSTERSIEVDFLRGAVLIVIVLDHNLSGLLRHAMLHSYAYCDAAEVFVFLGGYASAAAYIGVAARSGAGAARRRFVKRAWEIYRSYLLTAFLMLACSAAFSNVSNPVATINQIWPTFAAHPIQTLLDVVSLRQQPFLAAVLPMYVLFACGVPLSVPFAQRSPVIALSASFAIWLIAPWAGSKLPSATGEGWPFNPFAWQLMFTLGTLCRLYPISQEVQLSRWGRTATNIALVVAVGIAFVKLCIGDHPSPGFMKQNLAGVRIVSFLSIAWLCAQAVRLGWIGVLAERLSPVVTIGRQGLVCFIGGTVVSIFADFGLHLVSQTSHFAMDWPIRLTGDISEVLALLLLGFISSGVKRLRTSRSFFESDNCGRAEVKST